jgi:hypothetical protein
VKCAEARSKRSVRDSTATTCVTPCVCEACVRRVQREIKKERERETESRAEDKDQREVEENREQKEAPLAGKLLLLTSRNTPTQHIDPASYAHHHPPQTNF